MRKILIVLIILSTFIPNYGQENLLIYDYWLHEGDMSNTLYNHICSHAFKQINDRWSYVGGLKERADWINRQDEAVKIIQEIVGEFPEKTPLNPVVTGKIKKNGVVVEKLYFESRPEFYVTAALFMPENKKGKLPAILYCCGHTAEAFRDYQRSILNLVKKGFIVLAFDPIGQGERIQYFDTNGKSIFGSTHEHSYPGTQSFISGRSPANYFIWDGIRAVDYLISRKEVDAERIGITGASGGGTQSAYIAAMDERITASATERYITSFDKLLRSRGPQDAEQNLMYALMKGFDMSDLIEVRAPKPTLLVTTTQDIFSIQGSRDVFNEAKNAYIALDKPSNLEIVEDDAGHTTTKKNREAIHVFFQKFLNNPGNPNDEEVEFFDKKELWVTPTGQVQTSLKGETLFSLNEKYTEAVLKEKRYKKEADPNFYENMRSKVVSLTGYSDPALPCEYIFSGRFWRDSCSIEKYLVKGTGSHYVPLLRLTPKRNNGKSILLLDDEGKSSAAEKGGLGDKLMQEGYQVFIPDLSGFGELGGGYTNGDAIIQNVPLNVWYAGVLTHKSPLGIRCEEIKIIVGLMEKLGIYGEVSGMASGTLSADLLHSMVLNGQFNDIILINPLVSYQSIVQEKDYHTKFVMSAVPGVIGTYDLPDLSASVSSSKIYMLNPVDALGREIDRSAFERAYPEARNNLVVSINDRDIFSTVLRWLEQ